MNDGSDRHHAEARLILILFIVETRQRLGAGLSGPDIGCAASFSARGAAGAGGCSESEDGERRQTGAENDRRPGRDWKDAARDRKDSVADNSAKAGRQRPASGRRKERRQRRRRDHAGQVKGDFEPRPFEPPIGEKAPAPERGRRQQRNRGKADELHHEVGGDRARGAEEVVDAGVCRVIEARIADRPGQKREAQAGHAGERAQSGDLGRPPLREIPHRGGHVVDKRERRRTHRRLAGSSRRDRAPSRQTLGPSS